MRVLMVAYYFPPMGGMGSLRALSFARWLPEAGVEVTVVAPRTGTWGHDASLAIPAGLRVVRTGTLEPGVLLRRAGRGRASGGGGVSRAMGVGRLGGLKRLGQKIVHVPDGNVGWVSHAVSAGVREGKRRPFDAVLSSSPPLSAHLAAAAIASRLRVPLVMDVRDFFEEGRLFGGVRGRVDERIERRLIRRAGGFSSPYRGILDQLRRIRPVPTIEVRNGYDEEDFAGPPPPAVVEGLRLVHVGTTYSDRANWGPFLSAAAATIAGGVDLRLRFVGREDPGLARAAESCGIGGACEFAGYTTHADAIREMRSASALLLFSWGVEESLVLGKTFECLRAGPPVLAVGSATGAAANLLRMTGGALVVDRSDETGLRSALEDLAAGRGPGPANREALAGYTRRAQALRLAEWLRELIGSRR